VSTLIFVVQMTAAITTLILLTTCVVGALRWEDEKALSKDAVPWQRVAQQRFHRRPITQANRFTATPSRCWSCGQMIGS